MTDSLILDCHCSSKVAENHNICKQLEGHHPEIKGVLPSIIGDSY